MEENNNAVVKHNTDNIKLALKKLNNSFTLDEALKKGLDKSTIKERLENLERHGWLTVDRSNKKFIYTKTRRFKDLLYNIRY